MPKILSVFWHRVDPEWVPPDDSGNPTVSLFKDQLDFIINNYTPISITEFLGIIGKKESIRAYARPPILLGFDDGFRSVISNGLPILTGLRVPAVFFVMGELIKNPGFVPWFVEVKHFFRKTTHARVGWGGVELDVRKDRLKLLGLVEAQFRACRSDEERERMLDDLAKRLEVGRPTAASIDEDLRFVNANDLADLDRSSMLTVASHAMTHRHLAALEYDEQVYELRQSDSVLRQHCGSYYPVVAYPSGSFNTATIAITKGIYAAGFAVYSGSSYGNQYAYPRVDIGRISGGELAHVLSQLRLNYLLPLKRFFQATGLRREE